jgi:quercetin dioxygenase-like cupin family protein
MYYFDLNTVPVKELVKGVRLKAIYGEKIMMSFVTLDIGAVVPEHKHPHEQMGYVIKGELAFDIGGEQKICRPGDTYIAPGNVSHSVKVLSAEPAYVLDIFSPPREEYKHT